MEARLGVTAACRFPCFRPLMWHTAAHYLARLRAAAAAGARPAREASPGLAGAKTPAVTAYLHGVLLAAPHGDAPKKLM